MSTLSESNILHAVFNVGPQGVLIDTGFRVYDLELLRKNILNLDYSFKRGQEYIAVPVFTGGSSK